MSPSSVPRIAVILVIVDVTPSGVTLDGRQLCNGDCHSRRISVEDAQKADETFTMLMGEEVPPRKRFIQTHALAAELDV